MEVLIAVLFVIFMFLVDWRLNKIYKELKRLNETQEKSLYVQPVASTAFQKPQVAPEASIGEAALMAKHGITKEGDKYVYSGFSYDKLQDAVNYARR
jgi:hypothetical protein